MEIKAALENCVVDAVAKTITVPETKLEPKVYADLAKRLSDIGGKKQRGGAVFKFRIDPTKHYETLLGGKKINLKKDFQFFATPEDIADKMVALAGANRYQSFLEPSAGEGAIIRAIDRAFHGVRIDYCELMPENIVALKQLELTEDHPNMHRVEKDFFELSHSLKYDRIIANPPFSKNQDIDHVQKMYRDNLEPNGRLVAIISQAALTGRQKKQKEFQQWLRDIGYDFLPLPIGTFSESGTNVPATIIILDKP